MHSSSSRLGLVLPTCVLFFLASTAAAQSNRASAREVRSESVSCEWDERFFLPGFNGTVFDTLVLDGGWRPGLYVAGDFTAFEGTPLARIAWWDGSQWQSLGAGFDGPVRTLAFFDDGNGPALYAGGEFTRSGRRHVGHLARWDGHQWQAVGGGFDDRVLDLVVHDDGTGPALYASGGFTRIGGAPISSGLVRWDGTTWTEVPYPGGGVEALASFDVGTGAELYVAGMFEVLTPDPDDPLHYHGVLAWNGTSWHVPGAGLRNEFLQTLAVLDAGTGPALYAGGVLNTGVGPRPEGFWKWDGQSWQLLAVPSGAYANPLDFASFDDGTGPALYASGSFSSGTWGQEGTGLVRWTGGEWEVLPEAGFLTESLAVWESDAGSQLLLGGYFTRSGGLISSGLAGWDGTDWQLAPGARGGGLGLDDSVRAMAAYDDGTGPGIVVSGYFTSAGGQPARRVARWDGQAWSPLGGGFDTAAVEFAVFDAGTGPRLMAAGAATLRTSESPINGVAVWDGTSWSALGGGIQGSVFALEVHDDGSGSALYAGGRFTSTGQGEALRIARWDGQSWSSVGGGLDGDVYDLTVVDDGGGPVLYATGAFGPAFGHARIVRWDGSAWSTTAISFPPEDTLALRVLDDSALPGGTPASVYVLRSAFGGDTGGVARWDGSQWLFRGAISGSLIALETLEVGNGSELFAAGLLIRDSDPVGGLTRWDGATWQGAEQLLDAYVWAMDVLDDGDGPALFLGGDFRRTQGVFSSYFGKYSCQQP